MSNVQPVAEDQAAIWNGAAGQAWVDTQEVLDRLLEPFEQMLVGEARAAGARSVLDVGCGTGATTLAIARSLGAHGRCVGIDISEPMVDLARSRAERERVPASFVCADAEKHAFEPATFDLLVSRFGVMFFDDPVRAFANLRRAARMGAQLRLIAWRGPADNPFMTAAERAAAPLLPNLPPRRPDAPGQFAFADAKRVTTLLERGGWAEIELTPVDLTLRFPEKELHTYMTRLGPLGRVLQEVDAELRARILSAVRGAFAPFVHGDEVRFAAACWMIGGRAG